MDAQCNSDCLCTTGFYEPVCDNGVTYFSPCYAGCKDTPYLDAASNVSVCRVLCAVCSVLYVVRCSLSVISYCSLFLLSQSVVLSIIYCLTSEIQSCIVYLAISRQTGFISSSIPSSPFSADNILEL